MSPEPPYTAGYRDAIHEATRTLEEMADNFELGDVEITPALLRKIAAGIREGSQRQKRGQA